MEIINIVSNQSNIIERFPIDLILPKMEQKFHEYYRSREDCFGEFSLKEFIRKKNGTKRKKAWTNTNRGLTEEDTHDHLIYKRCLGGHPQLLDNTCSRMGYDIDEGNTKDKTFELCEILEFNGLIPFVSLSGGVLDNGSDRYHVDVFFSEPFAWNDTYFLGQKIKKIVGGDIEVFPKQKQGVNYGNWLKFPLGVHPITKKICYFVDWKNDFMVIVPRNKSIEILKRSDISWLSKI